MGRTNFPSLKQDGKDSPQQLALVVNSLRLGEMNNTLDVKLAASATSTDLTDPRFKSTSALIFCPKTVNAAAHPMTWFEVSAGAATLHHASTADTDKTGVLVIIA